MVKPVYAASRVGTIFAIGLAKCALPQPLAPRSSESNPDGGIATSRVRLIRATLSDQRWAVQVAGTAKEALHVAATFPPDVILLELVLPDMRGLDLVRLLKSNSLTADAAIVVATASNGPQSERLAFEAGSPEYLRKPIDVLSLPVRLASLR